MNYAFSNFDKRLSNLVELHALESAGSVNDTEHLEGESLQQAVTLLNQPLLAPFLKTLLVTDGTVTMAIQAYYGEPIEVKTLAQSLVKSPGPIKPLKLSAEDEILYREVTLTGAASGRRYASAYSIIKKAVVPEPMFDDLVSQRAGIGTLLRNTARGSYRDILKIRSGGLGDPQPCVNRTYCVYLDAQPAILITEVFPLNAHGKLTKPTKPHPCPADTPSRS